MVGHHVTVVYDLPGDAPVARAIEQTSATFVGTLDAIDASIRMVKAKHLVGDKKFNLADNLQDRHQRQAERFAERSAPRPEARLQLRRSGWSECGHPDCAG